MSKFLSFALLATVAGGVLAGCSGDKVPSMETQEQFEQALATGRPVLVDFYKGACPTCVPVDDIMATLQQEYGDRVIIAKFMIMKAYFAVTAPELKERYDIIWFPTVILFDDGREVQRWPLRYDTDCYRQALDAALADEEPVCPPSAAPAAPAGGPTPG